MENDVSLFSYQLLLACRAKDAGQSMYIRQFVTISLSNLSRTLEQFQSLATY